MENVPPVSDGARSITFSKWFSIDSKSISTIFLTHFFLNIFLDWQGSQLFKIIPNDPNDVCYKREIADIFIAQIDDGVDFWPVSISNENSYFLTSKIW